MMSLYNKFLLISIFTATLYTISIPSHSQEAEKAESIGALCTGRIWIEAIEKYGKFPFASYGGDTMCLAKGIWPEGVKEALNIMRGNDIKNIVISSTGGDVDSAITLAEEIHSRGIDVYVKGPCFSSCANYIFLAGRNKYVLHNGVVAWHGTPKVKEDSHENIKRIVDRHHNFYKKINVDERIGSHPPCDLANDPEFIQASKSPEQRKNVFWSHSRISMESEYNVRGIVYMWSPESARSLREDSFYNGVFLSNGCKNLN